MVGLYSRTYGGVFGHGFTMDGPIAQMFSSVDCAA